MASLAQFIGQCTTSHIKTEVLSTSLFSIDCKEMRYVEKEKNKVNIKVIGGGVGES